MKDNYPLPTHRAIGLAFAFFCCAATATAEEKDAEKSAGKLITPAAERSIDRGLKWLVSRQHDDGGFGTGPARGNVAVDALAGMALMSGGSTPGRGPYGGQTSRCVDYLLANSQPSGFIAGHDPSHGPMYGHGFATMFLAECYGMSPRPELREKLSKAITIIVNSQNKDGGWRYEPIRRDADISVTVCEIMALRAARNAGLFVPNDAIDRAIDYVKRSQNADGGFMYQIEGGPERFRAPPPASWLSTAPASTKGRKCRRGSITSCNSSPPKAAPDAKATTITATTMPCRPCGRPAASAGHAGTRPFATN